jgi:hypothetical protein
MTERVYWWMTHSPWGNRLAKFRQWVEPAGEWTFVAHETARDGTRLGPDSEPVVVNVGQCR